MRVIPHQLIAAGIVVCGAPDLARAEDNPPAAKSPQTNSQPHALDAQPAFEDGAAPARQGAGLVNGWLRSESSAFTDWDLGGQFRARYEHHEYLGPVDFSATGGHTFDDLMLLRTLVHVGYNPTPWLSVYTEGRDSRGFLDEANPNPDQDTMDLHQAYLRIGNPEFFPLSLKVGRQELIYG